MIIRTDISKCKILVKYNRIYRVYQNIHEASIHLGISNKKIRDIIFKRIKHNIINIYLYEDKSKPFKLIEYIVDNAVNEGLSTMNILKILEQYTKVVRRLQDDYHIYYINYYYDSIQQISKLTRSDIHDQLQYIYSKKYKTRIEYLYSNLVMEWKN